MPRQQTIQFLEPNSLCPAATCSRSHIPIQKQDDSTTRALRQNPILAHMERLSQPVSSEGDLAHTQQSITCVSPSQVGQHFDRSRGMDGKSRKFDPGKSVVNTPLCVTGPRVPLRSNLDDPASDPAHLICSCGTLN